MPAFFPVLFRSPFSVYRCWITLVALVCLLLTTLPASAAPGATPTGPSIAELEPLAPQPATTEPSLLAHANEATSHSAVQPSAALAPAIPAAMLPQAAQLPPTSTTRLDDAAEPAQPVLRRANPEIRLPHHDHATSGRANHPQQAPAQAAENKLSLTVTANDTVNAGQYIDYTFAYSNTSKTATATDVVVRATWTDFGKLQSCEVQGCEVLDFEGPPVIRDPDSGSDIRFKIEDLLPGNAGQFRVRLKTDPKSYPRTGVAPTRIQASGWIYQGGSDIQDDSDTFSATLVGPVFVLEKAPVSDVAVKGLAEFAINVGNASAAEDKPGGALRADARNANNVIVQDSFDVNQVELVQTREPEGVTVEVDSEAGTVTWFIDLIKTEEVVSLRVTYRNLDDTSCKAIGGSSKFSVTSDEMFEGLLVWSPPAKGVTFETSMKVKVTGNTPKSVYFGDSADVEIQVENWLEQPLNGVKLVYTIQGDASFEEDRTEGVDPSVNGQQVTWTFNMPAAAPDPEKPETLLPGKKTFTVRIRTAYVADESFGDVTIIPPEGIERVCAASSPHRVKLATRLSVSKYTDSEKNHEGDKYATYIVDFNQGETFPYVIKITNSGTTPATGVNITDFLPNVILPFQLEYVDSGYFTLDGEVELRQEDGGSNNISGQARIVREKPETLVIEDIDIPPESSVTIHYRLGGEVLEYILYCNSITAERPVAGSESGEPIAISKSQNRVCAQGNPDIATEKRMINDIPSVAPGAPVTFTLAVTNFTDVAYEVGMLDDLVSKASKVYLGGSFTFQEQISGYAEPEVETTPGIEAASWPFRELAPGESLNATIVASPPDVCKTGQYANSFYHVIRTGTRYYPTTEIVVMPAFVEPVPVVCAEPEIGYSKGVRFPSGSKTVPGGRVVYEIVVTNRAGVEPMSGITIEDVLPEGFRYRAMVTDDEGGTLDLVTTEPAQSQHEGRTKLTWNLDMTLLPGELARLRYEAAASAEPGVYDNELIANAASPPDPIQRCNQKPERCRAIEQPDESVKTYAFARMVVEEDLYYDKGASPATVRAGDTVVFSLVFQNNDPEQTLTNPIHVEDILPPGFTFVEFTEDSAITPQPAQEAGPDGRTKLVWNLDDDIPPREALSMKFVAKAGNETGKLENWLKASSSGITAGCKSKKAEDCTEGGYALASVNVLPPGLHYHKVAERTRVSLKDRVPYALHIRNTNKVEAINNITVEDILPEGFEYVEMQALSMVEAEPQIQENAEGPRTKLTWSIPSIPADTTITIEYIARSGDTTGEYANWLRVSPESQAVEAKCEKSCINIKDDRGNDNPDDDITTEYSSVKVDVRALITIEPRIEPENAGCANPGDNRTYIITISNANDHEYTDVDMDITMPIGLKYKRMITRDIAAPSVITGTNEMGVAQTILHWENIYVPEHDPGEEIITQVVIEVELEVGNVWHDLTTKVEAWSKDGMIPSRGKEDEDNPTPTVAICKETSGIRKDVDRNVAYNDEVVVYQVELFNVNETPISATVQDQLPGEFRYVEMVSDNDGQLPQPAYDEATNLLTWENLTLPVSDVLRLQYRVGVHGMDGQTYRNLATADGIGDLPFEMSHNSAAVRIESPVTMEHRIAAPPPGCVAPGTPLTYEVLLNNPNNRAYAETSVVLKLPFGLRYNGIAQGTPMPDTVRMNESGGKTLAWNNQSIPRGTTIFQVEVEVVPFAGQVASEVRAYSSSGLIKPPGLSSPAISLCRPDVPTVYKTVDRPLAQKGDSVQYTLTFMLPEGTSEINANVQDALPAGLAFIDLLEGPAPTDAEQMKKNILIWENLKLSSEEPLVIRFSALVGAEPRTVLENTVEVLESSAGLAVDSSYAILAVAPLVGMAASVDDAESCRNPGDSVTYTLVLENATDFDDRSMRVQLILPHGLSADAAATAVLSSTTEVSPTTGTNADGKETITWDNVHVLARPDVESTTQITLMASLQVNTALGKLQPVVSVSGLGGETILAPDKAPGVMVPCADISPTNDEVISDGGVMIALEAQPDTVQPNGTIEFLISAANFNTTPVEVVVESELPDEFYYVEKGSGQPSADEDSRKLVWTLNLPAAPEVGQVAHLSEGPQLFKARVQYNAPDGRYTSRAALLSNPLAASTQADEPLVAEKVVEVRRDSSASVLYLPLVQR